MPHGPLWSAQRSSERDPGQPKPTRRAGAARPPSRAAARRPRRRAGSSRASVPTWLSNGDTDDAASAKEWSAAIASGDSRPSDRATTVSPASARDVDGLEQPALVAPEVDDHERRSPAALSASSRRTATSLPPSTRDAGPQRAEVGDELQRHSRARRRRPAPAPRRSRSASRSTTAVERCRARRRRAWPGRWTARPCGGAAIGCSPSSSRMRSTAGRSWRARSRWTDAWSALNPSKPSLPASRTTVAAPGRRRVGEVGDGAEGRRAVGRSSTTWATRRSAVVSS